MHNNNIGQDAVKENLLAGLKVFLHGEMSTLPELLATQ